MAAVVKKYPHILVYSIENNLAPTIDFYQYDMGETVQVCVCVSWVCLVRDDVFFFVVFVFVSVLFARVCVCILFVVVFLHVGFTVCVSLGTGNNLAPTILNQNTLTCTSNDMARKGAGTRVLAFQCRVLCVFLFRFLLSSPCQFFSCRGFVCFG